MNVEYREGNEFERKGNDKVSGMHEKRERSTGVGNGNLLLHPIPRIRIDMESHIKKILIRNSNFLNMFYIFITLARVRKRAG